jgi:uncharacterized Zn-binding protein involved in type VI secretion
MKRSAVMLSALLLLLASVLSAGAVTFPAYYCGTGTYTFAREWKPQYETPAATCVKEGVRFKAALLADGTAIVSEFWPLTAPDLQGICRNEGNEGGSYRRTGTHDLAGSFTVGIYNYVLDANVPYMVGSFTEESLSASHTFHVATSASEEWITWNMELSRTTGDGWNMNTWTPCASNPLKLTYPAGQSPKVFSKGWIFGAECIHDGVDCAANVKWEGTGTFSPDRGPRSRPTFAGHGANRIELSVEIDGETFKKSYDVATVNPVGYARFGDMVRGHDVHACPACPHPVVGQIITGSDTVLIEGVSGNTLPAARVGDRGIHTACCGPNSFEIVGGDAGVLIDGRPAARIGDATKHCGGDGTIVSSSAGFHVTDGMLGIPSVKILNGGKSSSATPQYSVGLKLTGTNPIAFSLDRIGEDQSGSEFPATFDPATGRLHILYLFLGGATTYNADLDLAVLDGQLAFALTGVGVNLPESDPKYDNVRPISSADLWDLSRGSSVTGSSGMLASASSAENIFGDGEAVFQDGQPVGTTHWIEWTTAAPVTVGSINLVAAHDGDIRERGFSAYRLSTGDGAGNWTLVYEESTDRDGNQRYGGGPNLVAENYLETSAYFSPVTARHFRAEFVQAGGSGPRVIELDAYPPI